MSEKAVLNSLKKDYQNRVALGYQRMRQQRAVLCATVRDCAKPLKRNMPFVEQLRGCFAHTDFIVVENDSVDGTKELLSEWQSRDSNITLLGEDTGVVTIPEQRTGAENPWFSYARIEKMAGFRNQYLEHIEKLDNAPDVLVVLDLDCRRFFLDGVAHSFGQEQTWDMIAANGREFRNAESVFFDTYAFRERGMPQPQTEKEIYDSQTKLAPLGHYMPLFAVDSAFGGLALYRYPAVQGRRYGCVPNDDPEVTVLSEHPCLHKSMRQNGYDRLFINPNMILHYNKPKRRASLLADRSLPRI